MLLNIRVAKTQVKRKPPTPEEMGEANRLMAIYKRKKPILNITQETLAAQMGFSTQGAVSQYLNGATRLGNEAIFRFAYHLQFDPTEVRPDIFDRMPIPEGSSTNLDEESLRFARRFSRLGDDDRKLLQSLVEKLHR